MTEHDPENPFWLAVGIRPDPETYLPVLNIFIALPEGGTRPFEALPCEDCGGDHQGLATTVELSADAAISAGLELIRSGQMFNKLYASMEDKTVEERRDIVALYNMFNSGDYPEVD